MTMKCEKCGKDAEMLRTTPKLSPLAVCADCRKGMISEREDQRRRIRLQKQAACKHEKITLAIGLSIFGGDDNEYSVCSDCRKEWHDGGERAREQKGEKQ